jgi:hypothetical protein
MTASSLRVLTVHIDVTVASGSCDTGECGHGASALPFIFTGLKLEACNPAIADVDRKRLNREMGRQGETASPFCLIAMEHDLEIGGAVLVKHLMRRSLGAVEGGSTERPQSVLFKKATRGRRHSNA